MSISTTIQSMYENVGEVYDTITNVDVNNGKNLFKGTLNNGIINQGGTYISNPNRITNADSSTMKTFILKKGTYTLSIENIDACTIVIKNESGSVIQEFADSWKTLPYTFTTTNDGYFYFSAKKNIDSALTPSDYKPMLEKGSSATEYQPYTDNPIYKNIENIPSTIRKSYLDIMNNGIDTIYDNWEKVNGTGTSISLNNTEEAPMTIEYKGNTSQETTTGKNLFIPKPNNSTSAGITYSLNEDGTINLSGTSTNVIYFTVDKNVSESNFVNGNTYTFSSNKTIPSGVVYKIEIRTATSWLREYAISNSTPTRTFTIDLTDAVLIRYDIQINNGTTPNLTNVGIQIESGSSATTFEPYTNGASPNPNYPQDIHIVSGDNSIKVEGKNLIPFSDIISTGGTTSNGITFTLQADGTIKANGTATAGISIYLTTNYIEQKAGTYTFSDGIVSGQSGTTFFLYADVRHLDETSWDTKNFSTAETTTRTRTMEEAFIFKPRIVIRQGQILNNLIFKPMLEKGSTATTYEAYKGASYEINLGKNLLDLQTSIIKSLNTSGTWNENVYTNNGLTITINEDKTIKINGTATAQETFLLENQQMKYPTGTYYLSGAINGGNNSYDIRMFNYDGTSVVAQCYTGVKEINVINNKQVYNVAIVVRSGQTLNNVVFYPMFSTSNDTNYSPYFTPIELCKIGTYQDRIFKSSGKNLFNDTIRQGVTTYDGGVYSYNATRLTSTNWITLRAGTYTINAKTNTSKTLQISNITFDTNDNFYNLSGVSGIWKTLPFTFTTPIDIKWKCNFDYSDNSNITINEVNSIMLNEGTTATTYEPYGKDWYLNKQIGKVVLGSTSYSRLITNYSNVEYIEINKPSNFLGYNSYDKVEIKINKATWMATTTGGWDNAQNIGKISGNAHNLCWWMGFPKNTGIDNIKTQLEDAIIYYPLATPTYEKITGELLNQLEAIKNSYENQTNINQENNDLPFELEVGALEKY